jgi:hypothetical protein
MFMRLTCKDVSLTFHTLLTTNRPATQRNEDTGEEFATTETWLWMLISRPVLSYDPMDTSTYVAPNPSSDDYVPPNLGVPAPDSNIKRTPPNFPHPTPLSWVVFAAPKAHVTTYPETIETHDGDGSIAQYPFASPSRTIHKRIDYDFSFSGIPLFEFSSSETFSIASRTGAHHKRLTAEFLSIEQMGGFHENDEYAPYKKTEYARHCQLWRDGEWPAGKWVGVPKRQRYYDDDVLGMPKGSMPPPNRGVWWKSFYERMARDVERWRKIRACMGRGKCRVVVRWTESPEDERMQGGVDGGTRQSGGVRGKKVSQGKRKPKNEVRYWSGLRVADPPSSLGIAGVAGEGVVVDSGVESKAGAVGKRELGHSGGSVVESENKVRRLS